MTASQISQTCEPEPGVESPLRGFSRSPRLGLPSSCDRIRAGSTEPRQPKDRTMPDEPDANRLYPSMTPEELDAHKNLLGSVFRPALREGEVIYEQSA